MLLCCIHISVVSVCDIYSVHDMYVCIKYVYYVAGIECIVCIDMACKCVAFSMVYL